MTGGALFPSFTGEHLDPSKVINRVREAMAAVDYDWVTSHVFRKTVATMLDEAGLPTTAIADQLDNTRAVAERHTASPASPTKPTPTHSKTSCERTTMIPESFASFSPLSRTKAPQKGQREPLTCGEAPPVGLEPTTLRLTAECSAN